MVNWLKRWRQSFLLSIACHMLLLAFFYKSILVHPIIGMHTVTIEHVYLFHAKNNHARLEKSSTARQVQHPVNSHIMMKLNNRPASSVAAAKADNHLTAGVRSLLLEQLHDDVTHHLIYPDSAVALDLSGVVMLKFLLCPSGIVSQVSVVHSSGSPILDDAARSTLYAISPFTPAEHYLHRPDFFTIPVAFEIS